MHAFPEHWTNELVFCDSAFPLAITPDDQHVPTKLHWHDFVEIVYVARGAGHHQVQKKNEEKGKKAAAQKEYSYPIMAGDMFLVDRREKHVYTNTRGLEILNILFLPSIIKDEMKRLGRIEGLFEFLVVEPWFRAESGFRYKLRLGPSDRNEMEALISRLRVELRNRKSGYKSMARALFIELLVTIGRTYAASYASKPAAADLAGKRDAIMKAIFYIEQNYARIVSLSSISNKVFLSPNYFCELFKTKTGLSPWEYLTRTRLEEAKSLLKNTNRKILDIAFSVGFNDESYFGRVFKASEGCSPHEFRKKSYKSGT